MKDMLAELLTSKKFMVLAMGCAVTLAVKLGLDAETSEWLASKLIPLAIAYIAGQGIADFGKGKAKLDAATLAAHMTAPDPSPAPAEEKPAADA